MNTSRDIRLRFLRCIIAVLGFLSAGYCAGITFSYDSLNRLTQVTYANGSTISYTYDAAGNRLTYSGISTNGGDTVDPGISILSPTNGATYSTASSSITLSGIAADNFGVSKITWQLDDAGFKFGLALGTTNWTIPNLPLQTGANTFTLAAYDLAGNIANAFITVTYTPPSFPNITGLTIISSTTVLLSGVGPAASLAYIQTSANLIHWHTISVLTNAAGSFQFPYPISPSESKRFFRVLPPSAVPASPQVTGMGSSTGLFRFSVNGLWGDNYVVQASTNLTQWVSISTNTIPAGGFIIIVDPSSTNFSRRFYRAVSP